ncbi:MAG: glucose-6-phosphate dehydrogenase [Polyangia bacterium]
MDTTRSDGLVFFGATGDLAHKQIFPALQALVKAGRLDMPIVAVGRGEIGLEAMAKKMKASLDESGDASQFDRMKQQLRYVAVDYDDPTTFEGIKTALGGAQHPLAYVALPPETFEKVARNLAAVGLAKGGRLALEKPFGHDQASAKALTHALHAYFPEEAIFRLDHFLGKEPVEGIVYFRAANPFIESAMDREHVESIQITMAETFGVKGRARFYDSVGAMRDVVQNHMLELVACLTMDLPGKPGHSALQKERSNLLAQIHTMNKKDLIRGQARGYLDEDGVAKDSKTETFAALRLHIDSPRWDGVPIYIRAGKSLKVTATEAIVTWKTAKRAVLDDAAKPARNHLRFRLGPDTAIAIGANVKKGGEAMTGEAVELELQRTSKDTLKPYERLIGDAIAGDATLFARKDAVEQSWRVVDPVIGNVTPVHTYEPGSWGPEEAKALAPPTGWYDPAPKPAA